MSAEVPKEIPKPGQSDQLILPSEAQRRNPDFFRDRPGANWILRVQRADGIIEEITGCDVEIVSKRFGRVVSAVVTDEGGQPLFDRPRYEEAPNINIVAWGRNEKGEIKVALISQPRPHADDPTNPENTQTLIFSQIPMGFKERVLGKDQLEAFESSQKAAERETQEETGATVIKGISQPAYPYHNPNPTFVGTWADLLFVEVDLERVEKLKYDRNEPIFKADYVPLKQLFKDLRAGETERGIIRMCTANSALLIFLASLKNLLAKNPKKD